MARNTNMAYETSKALFPTRLKEMMDKKGLTQQGLADFVHMQRQTISLYISGQSKPNTDALKLIVQALDCTADYLLGLTDDPHRNPAAVDELGLSPEAVTSLKLYASITNYENRSLFEYFLTHKNFKKLIIDLSSILYYESTSQSGTVDMSHKHGVRPLSVMKLFVDEQYKEPLDKMIECFGSGSGIISKKDIIEVKAMSARMEFDVILNSLLNEVRAKDGKEKL